MYCTKLVLHYIFVVLEDEGQNCIFCPVYEGRKTAFLSLNSLEMCPYLARSNFFMKLVLLGAFKRSFLNEHFVDELVFFMFALPQVTAAWAKLRY